MTNFDLDFYRPLRSNGLTHSRRHFSTEWLGAAPNYACLRAERGPSERALIHLFRALWARRRFLLAVTVARAVLWRVQLSGRSS